MPKFNPWCIRMVAPKLEAFNQGSIFLNSCLKQCIGEKRPKLLFFETGLAKQ